MKSYIGIDWSEKHHNVCILNKAGACLNRFQISHTLAGFQSIEQYLAQVNAVAADCLVAIETDHNTLVDFLWSRGYTLYILPPNQVKSNRGRHRASRAKDDDNDALLLADILRTDQGRLIPWQADSDLAQQMRSLLSWIDNLIDSIKRHRNRLRANLLSYYPQPLAAFGNMMSQFSLKVVAAYPSQGHLRTLTYRQFMVFSRGQGYYQVRHLPAYYAQLRESMPAAPETIWPALEKQTVYLARQLLTLMEQKQVTISQTGLLFEQHPDAPIFASLPGAGDLLKPKLLVMFGDHRSRYPKPSILPAIAGTCPVTVQSGRSQYVRFRWACNRSYRQTAQQFAKSSIRKSVWAAGYFNRALTRGMSDSHAYRCLANRWLHIIWTLWQKRVPYDEAHHLNQVARHRKPLVGLVSAAPS
ncbi:MAG: IS110 family transposase [Candidatus Promineifilaceae bacterium]